MDELSLYVNLWRFLSFPGWAFSQIVVSSVIFVNENENENDEKRENNQFVN